MREVHLGLDLGGTKLEAVALAPGFDRAPSPGEAVLARRRVPTDADEGYEAVLARCVALLRGVSAEAGGRVASVGVGLPGHVSSVTGGVKNSNTRCLLGRTVRQDLSAALGVDVATENDANLFALAEAAWGAGRGARTVFGVILGTGVGGGIVVDGRVWVGPQGIGGEWGHVVLEADGRACYCGRRGCVETWLSGPGLERSLREVGREMTAAEFDARWRAGAFVGDAPVEAVAAAYLERFGRGLATVINVLDPEVVVLGGGMGRWPALYDLGRDAVARWVFNDTLLTRILPPMLGDAAGVFGAALQGLRPIPQV